jgi:tRNA pseudouridine38-40 synthase
VASQLVFNKQRLRMLIAYDGTDFFGWQKQPHSEPTVQGLLENKLSQIFNRELSVVGSGRTDRGVHALNQWAHFDLLQGESPENLQYKLNRMTPESLVIKRIEQAPEDFHAQISAATKCYKYRLLPGKIRNPFQERYTWALGRTPSLESLQKMALIFEGEHDFTSFQSQGTPVSSPVRKILVSRWVAKGSGVWEYQVRGTGFLKQMVRNMVGTMIKLEQFQDASAQIRKVLESRDRKLSAAPAPPQGLFLSSVQYPEILDNKCRKL